MFFLLTGRVELITEPKQVNQKIWHRDLILAVDAEQEPAEGSVKIQFADEAIPQLEGLLPGDAVSIAFTIRGVPYAWQGETKHLVVLMGQVLQILPTPANSPERVAALFIPVAPIEE